MPKARRAPIWVVWSRRIGCCRMACDNLWCRMNAERRSPVRPSSASSRYPGKNRLAGKMAGCYARMDGPTNQRNMASERARGLNFSLPLSRPLSPSHYHYHPQQRERLFYFPEILGGFVGGPITEQVWTVGRQAGIQATSSPSAVWSG